jgi:hypothetical protein
MLSQTRTMLPVQLLIKCLADRVKLFWKPSQLAAPPGSSPTFSFSPKSQLFSFPSASDARSHRTKSESDVPNKSASSSIDNEDEAEAHRNDHSSTVEKINMFGFGGFSFDYSPSLKIGRMKIRRSSKRHNSKENAGNVGRLATISDEIGEEGTPMTSNSEGTSSNHSPSGVTVNKSDNAGNSSSSNTPNLAFSFFPYSPMMMTPSKGAMPTAAITPKKSKGSGDKSSPLVRTRIRTMTGTKLWKSWSFSSTSTASTASASSSFASVDNNRSSPHRNESSSSRGTPSSAQGANVNEEAIEQFLRQEYLASSSPLPVADAMTTVPANPRLGSQSSNDTDTNKLGTHGRSSGSSAGFLVSEWKEAVVMGFVTVIHAVVFAFASLKRSFGQTEFPVIVTLLPRILMSFYAVIVLEGIVSALMHLPEIVQFEWCKKRD